MLCKANTRHIVLQSRSLVYNTTSSGHFGHANREQNHTIFRCYKIANFFQTRFKLLNSVLKMLNFQNIEKVISLHMYFKVFCSFLAAIFKDRSLTALLELNIFGNLIW